MRRYTGLLLVAMLAAHAAATVSYQLARADTQPAVTVAYPPGWNLVGGPAGTVLIGALGPLYTLQYTDNGYETVPAGTALTGGLGYWAYFPNSGSAALPAGGPCVISVAIGAGDWVMVGDPWPTGTVTVRGPDIVETYTPGGGYQTGVTLRPGQAAWAYASVKTSVALTVDGCATVSTVPPSAPVPPPPALVPLSALVLPPEQ